MSKNVLYLRGVWESYIIACTCGYEILVSNTIEEHSMITCPDCGAKASLAELRRKYTEAFNRPYDRASGLKFERVLCNGGEKK